MYPGISHIVPSERAQDNWYSECTILCAQNDDVDHINETILKSFLGELKSYCNIDKIINILEAHYSSDYLNSINASGLPLSELNLKVGCPIMILHNLDPANGLCNGARAILTKIASHVLEELLIGGQHDCDGSQLQVQQAKEILRLTTSLR